MVHHKLRYKTSFSLTTYFYGEDLTPNEISTAKQLVQSNACNLNVSNYETIFLKNPFQQPKQPIQGVISAQPEIIL